MKQNNVISDEELHCSIFPVERIPGTMIIKPQGIINTYNENQFRKQTELLLEEGFINLIFDLGKIKYISAAGVGVFILLQRRVKNAGGEMILLEMQPQVVEIFNILGITKLFTIRMDKMSKLPRIEGRNLAEEYFHYYRCPSCGKILLYSGEGEPECPVCKTVMKLDSIAIEAIEGE